MRIGHIVYVSPQPGWRFPYHDHADSVELSFLRSGAGTFLYNNTERNVKKGDLIVKNAGLAHAERSDSLSPMDQICIEVHEVEIPGLANNHLIKDDISPILDFSDNYDLMCSIFTFLMEYAHVEEYDDVCNALMRTVIELIRIKTGQLDARATRKKILQDAAAAEIKKYVDEHYKEKLTAKEVASRFFISEGHLSRVFKNHTGFTLNNYIIDKRMGEARKMLIFSDADIKDVAVSCGYRDLQYFYRVFKQSAGCTPREYREMYAMNCQ